MRWFKRIRLPNKRRRKSRRGRLSAPQRLEWRLALSGAPPVAVNESYLVPAGAPFLAPAPGVLANDLDAEGDSLAAQLFSSTAHGTLSLSADGEFTYVPDAGFTGIDTFVYRVSDGTGLSELAAATLRVGAGDPPPQLDLDGDDSTATGLDFSTHCTEGGQPVAIADADASLSADFATLDSLEATISNRLDGADETLTANTSGTAIQAVYDAVSGRLTLSGLDSVDHYLQVLKTIAYQNASHHPNVQTRLISVIASDGSAQSAPAVAHVSITAVNDPATAADDAWTTAANTSLTVTAAGVLSNDSDPDGDPLTAVLENAPQHGSLQMAADGSFIYTPASGFSGTDQFSYRASDGTTTSATATVVIHVAAPAAASPAAGNDVYQAVSGAPLSVPASGILANDHGSAGGSISAELVANPLHGTLTLHADGSFEYVPQAGFSGLDGFTYQAREGQRTSDVASVTINVAPAISSDLPGAIADAYLLGSTNSLVHSSDSVLSNDAADGGALTAVVVVPPVHGTLVFNADGTFSYTANSSFHGVDQFSYKASNASGDSTAQVQLVSQPAELIRKLYRNVLNRDPTLTEWQQGTDLLTQGQKTLDQIAATLLNSDEYLQLKIEQFYHDYLHRDVETSGLDYWRDQIWRTGAGPDDVEIGILASQELWQASGGSQGAWVAELYRRYLDREPEQQGYDYWTRHLADGSMDHHRVALGFVISAENDRNLAAGWYSLYLDREITSQEKADLVAQLLGNGSHREERAQEQIVATVEYQSTPALPGTGVAQRET